MKTKAADNFSGFCFCIFILFTKTPQFTIKLLEMISCYFGKKER